MTKAGARGDAEAQVIDRTGRTVASKTALVSQINIFTHQKWIKQKKVTLNILRLWSQRAYVNRCQNI